ncbi:phosphomannomutase [Devosia sp. L53-10-65]|uniref:Phosphomannomutase n=1 Tax=Devosia marina TaxID=2683198 RepID=A0A7X3FPP4_9HYPH|nr:phosphomannomutase [Devosia marina]MVS98489.1 phosphomannomutase [Devosia marina]
MKFGTSGLRGLAVELEGQAARQYTTAFLRHLDLTEKGGTKRVFLGHDFRPSSRAILKDCAVAIKHAGLDAVDCGALPTPALALHALAKGGAAIMITGSHIPADRNGLKFYSPNGEIGKADEKRIVDCLDRENIPGHEVLPINEADQASERYFERFASFLTENALTGRRIGVFEHSTVARDFLGRVLRHFGAETVSMGRIDGFVPVDTEAFGDAVFSPIAGWIREYGLDAVVSADGDGDRPLMVDEAGQFIRGDVLGLLAARHLQAQSVVTPVTSNSAIEALGLFELVLRTRVGSPFVVEAINGAPGSVIGFEANGGTFVGQNVVANGQALGPLVTRDAVLPILCALGECVRHNMQLSEIVASVPLKHALADRLQNVANERSDRFLMRLRDEAEAERLFASVGISRRAEIDGLQFWTGAGDMVHFRASGNAPELRCYVEAGSPEAARDLLDWGMQMAARETSK